MALLMPQTAGSGPGVSALSQLKRGVNETSQRTARDRREVNEEGGGGFAKGKKKKQILTLRCPTSFLISLFFLLLEKTAAACR